MTIVTLPYRMFTPAPHTGFPLPPLSSSGLADSGSGRPLEGLSVFGPSRLVRSETDGASEHRQSTLEPRRRRRLTFSSLFGRPSVRPLRSRCSHRFSVVPHQPADDTVAQSLRTFLPLVPLDRVDISGKSEPYDRAAEGVRNREDTALRYGAQVRPHERGHTER